MSCDNYHSHPVDMRSIYACCAQQQMPCHLVPHPSSAPPPLRALHEADDCVCVLVCSVLALLWQAHGMCRQKRTNRAIYSMGEDL